VIDLIIANLQAMGANPTTATDKNGQAVIKVNAPTMSNNKKEESQK
jgi:hypothetical protein